MLLRVTLIALLSAAPLGCPIHRALVSCDEWGLAALPPQSKPIPSQPVEDLEELVDRLIAHANLYRATLPSLTADEDIVSDASYLGMFRKRVEAHATFRAIRKPDGGFLNESRQITILNGKPVPPGEHVNLPSTLFGGFGRFQDMFFTTQHRPCFNFVLAPNPIPGASLQIDITLSSAAAANPGCEPGLQGLTGIARIDPASGQLTHLERTIPAPVATRGNYAIYASVDSAPTKVGDETFWLPTLVIGDVQQGKIKGRFTAHYSNYHRYTATSTILPVTTTPIEPNP